MRFILAGLDFVFDRDGEPYFLEANSSPGGLYEYERIYGHVRPLDKLIETILERVEEPRIALVYRRDFYKKYKKFVHWKSNVFGKRMDAHVCILEDQKGELFIDVNGKEFKPNVLLTSLLGLKERMKDECFIVNPLEISLVVRDKFLCYLLVKEAGIRTPETFLIRSREELLRILAKNKETFKNGFVVKPRYGMYGVGVRCFSLKDARKVAVEEGLILQQRVNVSKVDGNFWDVRTFVVNGEYCGGIKRVSKRFVVNLSQGGKAAGLEGWIERRVGKLSERVVRVLDEGSKEFDLQNLWEHVRDCPYPFPSRYGRK